jgi:hypothetical protein
VLHPMGVCPRNKSARNRCPCVLIASKSQCFSRTQRTISIAGSPNASSASVAILPLPAPPCAAPDMLDLRRSPAHRARAVRARRPSIGDVQQHHAALEHPRQRRTCSRIVLSASVASSVTRIVWYMRASPLRPAARRVSTRIFSNSMLPSPYTSRTVIRIHEVHPAASRNQPFASFAHAAGASW